MTSRLDTNTNFSNDQRLIDEKALEDAFQAWAKLENGNPDNPNYKDDIMKLLAAAIGAYCAALPTPIKDADRFNYEPILNPSESIAPSHAVRMPED